MAQWQNNKEYYDGEVVDTFLPSCTRIVKHENTKNINNNNWPIHRLNMLPTTLCVRRV